MRKGWLIVTSLVVAIALLGVAGCAAVERGSTPPVVADTGNTQQRGIWVSGQGKVSVTPDIAALRLGIEAQADTVAEAMSRAAQSMEAVIAALEAHGVAEEDIQTFRFSISQVWDWDRVTGERELTGYLVSNMVSARIRALDEVGLIIDAVVEAGGDLIRIHGIGFTVEDPTAHQEQAREKAFADARAKAKQLAQLAGVTLGKPTFISEGMAHFPPMPMPPRMAMDMEVAPVTPIMPGEQEIIINVQVVFAIE
ncbi:SIMPL domain-containing protein [Dehalococcoidia bacterium]|nr:SIMPL domain-containing protein [Dehalococcoidia bacterium]MCL0098655.1 SIMPL domain-containing protein [Dehalococcoidia bacterium]MCL0104305.1 SIMPL domain-containing protein [Dehalococcoidia bacterium]